MAWGLSLDLRRRVIGAWLDEELTREELAERFGIGVATVGRWIRRYRETGDVHPLRHGGGQPRRIRPEQEPLLEALVQAHPDWTETEYADALFERQGIQASASTVGRVIRSLGYTVKKRPSLQPNETKSMCEQDGSNTSPPSDSSPFRVWFSWTKQV
jgi:transposase